MTTVLVTGANGQLATCIKKQIPENGNFTFLFYDSIRLDISSKANVDQIFSTIKFDWCINCAAYTNVDRAEQDFVEAQKVNVLGAKNLAEACKDYNTKLIHISTDFVFNGKHHKAYSEKDEPSPINVYGQTKLDGEMEISSTWNQYFILRTSWLYSEFGHNFLRTVLKLSKEKSELSIVDDQISTPTYAGDLAAFIINLIIENRSEYGLYNYSNEGVASWYDFAKAIFEISNTPFQANPIPSINFPTPAKRPNFSVLQKVKIKNTFNVQIPYWRDSLRVCIDELKSL